MLPLRSSDGSWIVCFRSPLAPQTLLAQQLALLPGPWRDGVRLLARSLPLADQCSTQAWKRAGVWGYTRVEAEERLVKHLMSSGLHAFSKEEAEAVAMVAEYGDGEWGEEPPQKAAQRAA